MFNPALGPDFIFIVALFVIAALLVIVTICLIYLLLTDFTSDSTETHARKIKTNAYNKAFSIIEEAKSTALGVLEEANKKAQQLISDSASYNVASKTVLEREIHDISAKQMSSFENISGTLLNDYRKSLEEQESKNITTLQSVSESLKGELLHEVDEFKNILHRETIESQQRVDQKISAEFKKAEDEIEAYKNKQMKNIDDKVYSILATVSKEVLGKVLSVEDHEDLIIKALETAKQQGVFDLHK